MRVTNGMIVNTTLTGLNNSMSAINKTYAQMVTGKKIQTVSDDPIIAGRALKLKTNVLETSQYQSNTKEANSWMEITEGALKNIYKLTESIRVSCVEASTGTLSKEDKNVIKEEMNELLKQLYDEANVTYAGRYVFSGYKTNEPLVLAADTTLEEAQTLEAKLSLSGDMKGVAGTTLKAGSVLAKGTELGKDTILSEGDTLSAGTVLSKQDAENLLGVTLSDTEYQLAADYTLSKGQKYSSDSAQAIADALGRAANTNKEDYFTENEDGTFTLKADQTLTKGSKLSADAAKEVLGVDVSADSYQLIADYTIPAGGHTVKESIKLGGDLETHGEMEIKEGTTLASGSALAKGSVLAEGTTLGKGTLNPKVNGKIDKDAIQYEIGVNSTITVNTNNMDTIYVDLIDKVNEIFTTIDASLEEGSDITTEDLHKLFDDKIEEFDKILGEISKANTDLGSRMVRVDYVSTRLTDQSTTLKGLLTETEDIDIEEVYVNFNTQYATYQSALQATSKIITNTLADYL